VFFASIILSATLTPLLEPYYGDFFEVSGSWIFPPEVSTYPGTAALLYILFVSILYVGLSNNYKGLNLFYFVILPLFLVSGPTTKVVILESVLLVTGFFLGKLIRNNLRK